MATNALTVNEVEELQYVDNLAYRCVLQFGSRRRWRNLSPGEDVRVKGSEKRDGRSMTWEYQHVPAVHEYGPISGRVLNGLISSHNSWLRKNRDMVVGGEVQHQLVVVDHQETDEQVPGAAGAFGDRELGLIKAMVESTVKSVLSAQGTSKTVKS